MPCLNLDWLDFFKLYWWQPASGDIPANRVVKHLDVIEYVQDRCSPRRVNLPLDPLLLRATEEAFSHRIVVTVSSTARAGKNPLRFQNRSQKLLVNWRSWSEWISTFGSGLHRQNASTKACRTGSLVRARSCDHR